MDLARRRSSHGTEGAATPREVGTSDREARSGPADLTREVHERIDETPEPLPLHDLRVRVVGIPLLGLVIPQVTGLFGDLPVRSPVYWAGVVYFVLLSLLLWQGNRYLLIKQRQLFNWLDRPLRKAAILLGASVFYTVPLTVAMLMGWYRFAGFAAIDWTVIRTVTIIVLTSVVFVTHVYETVHLIQQRAQDALRVEQLERARIEAEIEALRNQVDPHFVFNSLNALAHLVETGSDRALAFTERLAEVYRYVLLNRSRELVPLAEELEFLDNYHRLVRLRYGDALALVVEGRAAGAERLLVPPISLQVLLENAVKHNVVSPSSPLEVMVRIEETSVTVENARHGAGGGGRTSRVGLQNLDARCRLIVGRGIDVVSSPERFAVRLPLSRQP